MVFEFVLTFITTFAIVGAISLIVNTFLPNRRLSKSKHFRILLTQSSVITLLLVFVV